MKRRAEGAAAERAQSPLAAAAALDADAAPSPWPKRACGGGGASLPPGALHPSVAAAWAEHLLGAPLAAVAAHVASSPLLAPALPGLPRLLQAAAELDAALPPGLAAARCGSSSLRGYVSLTRCGRAALWGKFECAAPSLMAADAQASLLVRLLLVDAAGGAMGGAGSRPHACVTRFTVALPASMAGFAARWGLGPAREVSVLVVTAHGGPTSASSSSSVPAWSVALPLLPSP